MLTVCYLATRSCYTSTRTCYPPSVKPAAAAAIEIASDCYLRILNCKQKLARHLLYTLCANNKNKRADKVRT